MLTEQYRPKTWGDVVGQEKVVQRIQALAKRGLAGRAYWLAGQSGKLDIRSILRDLATGKLDLEINPKPPAEKK